MKICRNCGNEVEDYSGFCDQCGCNVFLQNEEIKKKKRIKQKYIMLFILLVLFLAGIGVGGIFVYRYLFQPDNVPESASRIQATSKTEITTEEAPVQRLDYYSNIDKVSGEYGIADLNEFSYGLNGKYLEIDDAALGLLSAFEYDCDSDSENELVTLELLPIETGGACLSVSLFSNDGIISRIDQTAIPVSNNPDSAPILRIANEFSRIFVFLVDDKLCITQDVYDYKVYSVDGDYRSVFSDFYVYSLNADGIDLYRHYYCHAKGWDCAIGETENHIAYTYYPTDFSADVYQEWRDIKVEAYHAMQPDVEQLGLEAFFCSESEAATLDYVTSTGMYDDGFFEIAPAKLIATTDSTTNRIADQWDGVVKYQATDHTGIRDKINP